MSVQSLDMLIALKAIGLVPSLKNNDRAVASALLDHYNRRTGQCDPSLNRVAALIGVCPRTVMRSIGRIEAAGLFRRLRHGGHLNRNSYEPNWTRFRTVVQEWENRMTGASRARAATELSRSGCQPCQLGGDNPVTQTFRTNLSKETLRSLPRKEQGRSLGSPARTAAERRWSTALHQAFGSMPLTYGQIIEAIDDSMREAAIDAEMRRHGAGLEYIAKQLKLGSLR